MPQHRALANICTQREARDISSGERLNIRTGIFWESAGRSWAAAGALCALEPTPRRARPCSPARAGARSVAAAASRGVSVERDRRALRTTGEVEWLSGEHPSATTPVSAWRPRFLPHALEAETLLPSAAVVDPSVSPSLPPSRPFRYIKCQRCELHSREGRGRVPPTSRDAVML